MGLLNQKGKDADKKKSGAPKAAQGSKFMANKSTKAAGGGGKKPMTGGSQRGS